MSGRGGSGRGGSDRDGSDRDVSGHGGSGRGGSYRDGSDRDASGHGGSGGRENAALDSTAEGYVEEFLLEEVRVLEPVYEKEQDGSK